MTHLLRTLAHPLASLALAGSLMLVPGVAAVGASPLVTGNTVLVAREECGPAGIIGSLPPMPLFGPTPYNPGEEYNPCPAELSPITPGPVAAVPRG
ncbi:MAG: hypothetical protein ACTHMJ_18575 [Thermomicrobiales bacterium]|nr:hypothetical protein [Thermomicrobiales bacterium]